LAFFALSLIVAGLAFIVLYSMSQDINRNAFYAILAFVVFNVVTIGSIVTYQYLYYKYYYYNFEDDKAEIKKGVVAIATGHVQYNRIQNIFVDQDVMDRILGLYDVHYETAGESSGFYSHVDGLNKENSDKLVEFLNEKVLNKGRGDSNGEQKKQAEDVKETVDNDQRVFTRENVPIDSKIVWVDVFSTVLTVVGLLIFFSFRLLADGDLENEELKFFVTVIIGSVTVLAIIGSYIYARVWYKNFYFKFDVNGGLITEKVLAVKNTYLYYNRIQNIDVSQGVIARLLGLNELQIETAAEGSKLNSIKIVGLRRDGAEMLKNFLLEKSRKYHSV
jgi:putative membrane protein